MPSDNAKNSIHLGRRPPIFGGLRLQSSKPMGKSGTDIAYIHVPVFYLYINTKLLTSEFWFSSNTNRLMTTCNWEIPFNA